MKHVSLWLLMFVSTGIFAGSVPGDVNFGLDASPDNHAYKFRLIVNGSATTFPTGCVAPNTGMAQALSYGAIGVGNAKLTVQASDCTSIQDKWVTLNGYLDYNSNYWYNLFVNMNANSFHSQKQRLLSKKNSSRVIFFLLGFVDKPRDVGLVEMHCQQILLFLLGFVDHKPFNQGNHI